MQFPRGGFDEDQLKILQTIIELTCADLGIDRHDGAARKTIATNVVSAASAGWFDVEYLRKYLKPAQASDSSIGLEARRVLQPNGASNAISLGDAL